ncbi:MAG: hypothetical protein WAM78_09305 [Candidatus Sulfotelmatobacter sp.]
MLRIVLVLWCLLHVAFAGEVPNPVLTGTVNIVLANANGIVVLTDSNQTWKSPTGEPFTSSSPGQKLFRLDDRTVCTIAGFGATYLPGFPGFTNSAAGVLDSYADELRSKGGAHSFREKLTTLKFMFSFQLAGIGNLQTPSQAQVGDYEFELILAGFDLDGTAKLGKIVFSASLSPSGIFSPLLQQVKETTVGQALEHETAGIGDASVENILKYPAQLADEPEIGEYAASKAANLGSSLSTAAMKALAKSLARHSAIVNQHYVGAFRKWSPIGGRDQIAILEKGTIREVDQQLFEQRKVNTTPFAMLLGMQVDMRGAPPGSTSGISVKPNVALVLKSEFLSGSMELDDAYYFDDDFRDVIFYYNGGVLGFDRNNRLTQLRSQAWPPRKQKLRCYSEIDNRVSLEKGGVIL